MYDRMKEQTQLRQYLNQHHISMELGIRIKKLLREKYRTRKVYVREECIACLGELPLTVLAELRKQVYMPTLKVHPFFLYYSKADDVGISSICCQAASWLAVLDASSVFESGDRAVCAFFPKWGTLMYTPAVSARDSVAHLMECKRTVMAGEWLCEQALWGRWIHRGSLAASGACEILAMRAERFHVAVMARPETLVCVRKYAASYALFVSVNPDFASDIGGGSETTEVSKMARTAFESAIDEIAGQRSSHRSVASAGFSAVVASGSLANSARFLRVSG